MQMCTDHHQQVAKWESAYVNVNVNANGVGGVMGGVCTYSYKSLEVSACGL